jgi:hypothetical protein
VWRYDESGEEKTTQCKYNVLTFDWLCSLSDGRFWIAAARVVRRRQDRPYFIIQVLNFLAAETIKIRKPNQDLVLNTGACA